jgi:hypothetical protein
MPFALSRDIVLARLLLQENITFDSGKYSIGSLWRCTLKLAYVYDAPCRLCFEECKYERRGMTPFKQNSFRRTPGAMSQAAYKPYKIFSSFSAAEALF